MTDSRLPQRRFQFFSIVGYVIVLGLTWEFSLVLGAFSLANGGAAGAIWLTFVVCWGMVSSYEHRPYCDTHFVNMTTH